VAVNIRQNFNTGGFFMNNVRFGSFTSTYCWGRNILAQGTTITILNNDRGDGGSYNPPETLATSATQIGAEFVSANAQYKIFVIHATDCDMSGAVHG
jgi:hypothetical protein